MDNVQNIEKSLDQIEDVLESGSRFALTNKTVIDAEPIKTAIEDIRLNLPAEIAQARAVVADRNSIIVKARDEAVNTTTAAQDKARSMLSSAEAKVKEMVSKTEEFANKRVSDAQAQAQSIIDSATEDAKIIRANAQLEADALVENSEVVRASRASSLRKAQYRRFSWPTPGARPAPGDPGWASMAACLSVKGAGCRSGLHGLPSTHSTPHRPHWMKRPSRTSSRRSSTPPGAR